MSQIQVNSKLVRKNDIFIALNCPNIYQHIQEAIDNGASIVFMENTHDIKRVSESIKVSIIQVEDIFLLASELSKFQFPSQPKNCIAVTGTNGKSSIAWFINQLIHFNGKKSAMLGTVGLFINKNKISNHLNSCLSSDINNNLVINTGDIDTNQKCINTVNSQSTEIIDLKALDLINDNAPINTLTTPDALYLHKILQFLHINNIEYLAFEASSAALDQKRLHSVELEAACMTNLASDHLDYHKTQEAYIQSKLRLFTEVFPQDKYAIINENLYDLIFPIHKNLVTFGFNSRSTVYAKNIEYHSEFTIFDLVIDGKVYKKLRINLIGEIQLLNVLCAITCCYVLHVPSIPHLEKLITLTGRLELIKNNNGSKVFIDYAHTAEAFKQCLLTLKQYCNRLICVFGCGGDRDITKRKQMGEIAQNLVDIPIITDDNPRNEDPNNIRQEIKKYCPKAIDISARKKAIFYGLNLLQNEDILVIVGKGHETYQIYKNQTKYFNDREIVNEFYSIIGLGR